MSEAPYDFEREPVSEDVREYTVNDFMVVGIGLRLKISKRTLRRLNEQRPKAAAIVAGLLANPKRADADADTTMAGTGLPQSADYLPPAGAPTDASEQGL